MELKKCVFKFAALLIVLNGMQGELIADKHRCLCDSSDSPEAQYPYPPQTLEGENCICC